MMILALIVAAAAQPPEARIGPGVQASASVRIISGKRMTLGTATPEAELRRTEYRDSDGQARPARLIEFQ